VPAIAESSTSRHCHGDQNATVGSPAETVVAENVPDDTATIANTYRVAGGEQDDAREQLDRLERRLVVAQSAA
jgi:hypothetical protein